MASRAFQTKNWEQITSTTTRVRGIGFGEYLPFEHIVVLFSDICMSLIFLLDRRGKILDELMYPMELTVYKDLNRAIYSICILQDIPYLIYVKYIWLKVH